MDDLEITKKYCGAFFAGTDMSSRNGSVVNAYTSSTKNFQLKQSNGETAVRFGFNANVSGAPEIRDGVWVGSRTGDNVYLTRIKALGAPENVVETRTTAGIDTVTTIDLWGNTTTGDVSAVGITEGMTATQTTTLGGLLYDLCVAIGHTDLEDTT